MNPGRRRLIAVAALAVIACRPDAPNAPLTECPTEDFLGSFAGTAEGATTGQLAGCAYFTVAPTDDPRVNRFGLVLTHGVPQSANGEAATADKSLKLQRAGNRLAVGSHPAGTGPYDVFGGFFLSGDSRNFVITGGAVSISVSMRNVLRGTIDITATDSGTGATITVTGEFTAACVGDSALCNFAPTRTGEIEP
jgi:hypothetical protein